jgi:enamine deaminase RidA (YjgF/YER057c/UK114 family)
VVRRSAADRSIAEPIGSPMNDREDAGSSMTRPELESPASLPAPTGYSHVAKVPASSRLVWTSGQVPLDEDGIPAPAGDWEAQTRLALQNVGIAVEAGGATWADVFKLTFFVVDTSALPTVRSVRDEFVDTQRPPASTLVQVASLFRPDILIEVEAVAAVSASEPG